MREMEYDSASSCEGRVKDLEAAEELSRSIVENNQIEHESPIRAAPQWISTESAVARVQPFVVTEQSLSAQVMEYYHKYSQNSSLGRYFSLPESGIATDGLNYYEGMYESIPEAGASREQYVILASEERSRTDSSTPRERRRWVRPPLIGQPSTTEGVVTSTYVGGTSTDSRSPSPICKRPATETIPEEQNESSRENLGQLKDPEGKMSSPTSSVASHKPLEWDSGADVGYYNALPLSKEKDKKLCTIERMALARGCSAALRLDPEGTNESTGSMSRTTDSRIIKRHSMKPDANSTPLMGIHHRESGESESEIEITPIVKNHSPEIISECEEVSNKGVYSREDQTPKSKGITPQLAPPAVQTESEKSKESKEEPESSPLKKSASMNVLVFPLSKLSLKRSQSELNLRAKEKKSVQPLPPLIFNSTSSIATVVNKPVTCDKFIQTSLDTCSRESIGIQVSVAETSDDSTNEAFRNAQEANESAEEEEEKPPLPKRASSLAPKSLHSILKNSSNTYNIRDRSGDEPGKLTNGKRKASNGAVRGNKAVDSETVDKTIESSRINDGNTRGVGKTDSSSSRYGSSSSGGSNRSRNESSSTRSAQIPAEEDTTGENATGRASNSFEYFPGHVYQNVQNSSTSHVSSIDTGRESRCSTMPNTSSSIDEKLWGDSDNLVRDLERSVNILKSLVDANKCDKQVKKRLIHHVIKRLVTAKYTDDRIEHDLEENVPWNPADARNKVYRNEIIQALANKHNTTDSSADDWMPRKRNVARGISASPKKAMTSKEARVAKEIIDLVASTAPSTPNSDEFPFDRHTDRTVMDGRKARMGLRCEDRRPENANTDHERSESSECFLPQSHSSKQPVYTLKSTNVFYTMSNDKSNEKSRPTPLSTIPGATATVAAVSKTTTTSTSSSSKDTACHRNLGNDGIILVKERRRTQNNETDWRLPTTMSERRFEMGRCSNSESGDTKLINYAEMEKRNQLLWITNEISHLSNLKRLLQEPKKFNGRERGVNSPRKKIDQWTTRARSSSHGRNERSRDSESETGHDDKHLSREESTRKNFENHGQWSSHGNLNGGRSAIERTRNRNDQLTDNQFVRHTRKLRNSCTQTGSDGDPSGHSKTGGEIISSTTPILASTVSTRVNNTTNRGVCDVSVQTLSLSPRKLANAISTEPTHSTTCTNHVRSNVEEKSVHRHVCYCQRYAAHSRHSACIMDSARRCARNHGKHCPYRARDDRPLIITATTSQALSNPQTLASNSKSNDSRKEAKNQLNANCKSKYAIHELPAKAKARCAECELDEKILLGTRVTESRETGATSPSNDRINEISEICKCAIECNCEGRKGLRKDADRVNKKHVDEDEQRSPCCETNSEPEDAICHHVDCIADTRCERENDERQLDSGCETDRRKKISSNFTECNDTENMQKSCRTCGTIWSIREGKNVNRKCSCIQDYLKPVAYELKFDEVSEKISRKDRGMKIDKIGVKHLPKTEIDQTKATKSPPNSAKSHDKCDCDEDKEKDNVENNEDENQRPGTLKDFLATNKPQFLENVETRRRYMSEISQLRQLKKEKRKQLLAISGTSVFLKPQKPVKGSTTNAQRKISEYEMKLRLRMRYLRLNEVRNKRRQREKEEEFRHNHLMAKLFGQKLQEKVLRGQVDLSQSVSVISNL